tara:strand:- start:28 stop:810 length:783 start_codon:yes stop_codon:yes gene_type:complete
MSNNKIVLLLGMGRSGTTWLGSILDSNPNVLYKNEPFGGFHLRYPWTPFDRRYFNLSKIDTVDKVMLNNSFDIIFRDYSGFKKGHKLSFSKKFRKNNIVHEALSRLSFNNMTDQLLNKVFVEKNTSEVLFVLKEVRMLSELLEYYSSDESFEIIYQFRNPFSFYNSIVSNDIYTKGRLDALIKTRIRRINEVYSDGHNKIENISIFINLIEKYLETNKSMIFVIYWCVMNEYYFNKYSDINNVYFNKFEDLAVETKGLRN